MVLEPKMSFGTAGGKGNQVSGPEVACRTGGEAAGSLGGEVAGAGLMGRARRI